MRRDHVILLEFNELCPRLLDRWMREGQLPNFRRFFEASDVFRAVADETDPDRLEPWIQWYSLHTGLSYQQHQVYHLTSGPAAGHKDIWRMLVESGLRAGNCGSMNAGAFEAPGSFYLPDPWCTSQAAYPAELNIFHRFVSQHVLDNSTRGSGSLSAGDYLRFLGYMLSHGLRPKTIAAILRQLWSDTALRRDTAWRRVPLMDKLQFDLFRHFWRKHRPNLSSFFLNSTAHYQHAYWHCLFPEEFAQPPPAQDIARFGDAILYGYRQMDELLAESFKLEAEGATLILCTALSQQTSGRADRYYYRLQDARAFLGALGAAPRAIEPVMAHQYMAYFDSQREAAQAKAALDAITVDGRGVFDIEKSSADTVFFGCGTRQLLGDGARLQGLPNGAAQAFHEAFYLLPHTKSADHDPESVIWVKTGQHHNHAKQVSILDVVPTLLDLFGIDRKRFDHGGALRGESFLPLLRS